VKFYETGFFFAFRRFLAKRAFMSFFDFGFVGPGALLVGCLGDGVDEA